MQFVSNRGLGHTNPADLPMICPHCRRQGVFSLCGGDSKKLFDLLLHDLNDDAVSLGHRICPNPNCRSHVFIARKEGKLLFCFPPERIDFETNDIPARVIELLEEAITCHSNQCFTAAGMLVRKTLEALCDVNNATGDNLHQRLESLKRSIVLPDPLMEALPDLKLLGNDAAHITAKTFDEVGETEVRIAIELTKEILKALYQLKRLLEDLRSLKK